MRQSKDWMNYAVNYANRSGFKRLKVAALAVTNNKLIAKSNNKKANNSWADDLLKQLCKLNIKKVDILYLTINTMSKDDQFDLTNLLNKIDINKVYLGLPDPYLYCYFDNDVILTHKNIYRFDEDYQKKIFKQNIKYYNISKQNIKYNNYFYSNRISSFLKEQLELYGIKLSKEEISNNKEIEKLAYYISKKTKVNYLKAQELIKLILSEAFDNKYSKYDYAYDVRSINKQWNKTFNKIYSSYIKKDINKTKIINVGVGSGNEAKELFINCKNITFVDFAANGLHNVQKLIPSAEIIKGRAENLSMIEDNQYELYVSLRTYNSSFFEINKSIVEAYRVLKNNGIIILSISNGFLNIKENKVIPGVIIPSLNFVDIYKGLDIVQELSKALTKYNFEDINITKSIEEIYISAKVKKEDK